MAKVTWPEAESLDREAQETLPSVAAKRVQEAPFPVLLPKRKNLLSVAGVSVKPTWLTASMRADGVTVVVTASTAARVVPGVPETKGNTALRQTLGFVTQNEGIWGASWIENGVAYSLEVECDAADNPRCKDDLFVKDLANELVFVGGTESTTPGPRTPALLPAKEQAQ